MATCANCALELEPTWKFCISCGTRTSVPLTEVLQVIPPSAIRPDGALEAVGQRVNVLSVVALVLGCLLSPFAALVGHIAVEQITSSGERGLSIAWVAVVLGYLWLAALVVVAVGYLTTHG